MKQGFKIADSDIHMTEPSDLWERYLDPQYLEWVNFEWNNLGASFRRINKDRLEPTIAALYPIRAELNRRRQNPSPDNPRYGKFRYGRPELARPESMLEAMDVEGIDIGIVFRTLAAHVIAANDMDPEYAQALCRAYNDWAAEFCRANPGRLKLCAQVSLHDPKLAVAELRRAVEKLGAIAVCLPSHPINKRPFYSRDYDPLYAACQEYDIPVCLHGVHQANGDHISWRWPDSLTLAHAAGHGVEMLLACGEFLVGGVCLRFPRLRVAFLEGNCTWLIWWLWRLDEEWEKFGECDEPVVQLEMKPSAYFRRQGFISIDPDETVGHYVVAEGFEDNLVLSTDWPHDDSAYPHALDKFLALERIPEEAKRKILWENCARLYKFA